MAHAPAKGQGQRSLRSKVKVETVGQTAEATVLLSLLTQSVTMYTILCYCAHQKYGLECRRYLQTEIASNTSWHC